MEMFVLFSLFSFFVGSSCEIIVTLNLQEEKPTSTLVGNIAVLSGLSNNMSAESFSSLRYSFLDQTKVQSLFTINNDNGNLFTTVVIDKETECGFNQECVFEFDVAAHSSSDSRFEIISVRVILLDINDNEPMFPSPTITLHLSETAVVGSQLQLDEAIDLDSSKQNRIQSYQMVTVNSAFTFQSTSNNDNGFDLKLILQENIDRETKDNYDVQIIAKDGGNPQRTGVLNVKIQIDDENDNNPKFTKDVFEIFVKENKTIGSQLIKLHATDKDIGENGEIVYKFKPGQGRLSEDINNLFAINNSTGQLLVKGELMSKSGNQYDIYVEASDKGQPPKVAEALVKVNIVDVGNNKPTIRTTLLSTGNTGYISESSSVGTVIAHVTVQDTDSGSNGIVTCRILSKSFSLQVVPNKGYIVVVNESLDRETKDSHNVTITCSDHGTPVLTSTESFRVPISDENDNAPKFFQTLYQASIMENNAVGDGITQVGARDKDIGENAHIKFYLHHETNGKFIINQDTGVITANYRFDRENISSYAFRVLAIDGGTPAMTGTATVQLSILDQNDNKPSFNVPVFQFFVMENMPKDLKVGSLSAIDIDEADNKKVLFQMHNNYKGSVPFEIFPTGIIKTTEILDREDVGKYKFDIEAFDQGNPRQTSTTSVIVYVADKNDNKPFITFPRFGNESVSISYLSQIGTIITRIRAYDLDEIGPNSQMKYSIIGGNELDVFSIGETSGNIYLKRTYEITKDTAFRVRVNVSDMNTVRTQFSTQNINIILMFSNGSAAMLVDDNGTRNIIISITVVVLTIILSAIIITVIVILRRNDQKAQRNKKDLEKKLYSAASVHNCISPNPDKNPADMVTSIVDTPRKKKEVSFTFDTDDVQMYQASHTGSVINSQNEDDLSYKQHTASRSLNRILLDSVGKAKVHTKKPQQDNLSDSSGEITASDSGRGGSDLDLSLHSSKQEERHRGMYSPHHAISPESSRYRQNVDSQFQYENIQYANTHHVLNNDLRIPSHSNYSANRQEGDPDKYSPSYV